MKPAKRKSLKRRLTIQLLLFQIGSLFIVTAAIITYMSSGGAGSALLSPEAAQITANAIVRDKDNRLVLRETPEFIDLRNGTSDFWFVAVSEKGEIVQGGQVPEAFSNMDQQLSDVRISDVRDAALSYSYLAVVRIAVVRRASGPAGEFVMIGKGGPFSMTFPVLLFSNIHAGPHSHVHCDDRRHSLAHPQGISRPFRHCPDSGNHRYRQTWISIAGWRYSTRGATARACRQRRAETAG